MTNIINDPFEIVREALSKFYPDVCVSIAFAPADDVIDPSRVDVGFDEADGVVGIGDIIMVVDNTIPVCVVASSCIDAALNFIEKDELSYNIKQGKMQKFIDSMMQSKLKEFSE